VTISDILRPFRLVGFTSYDGRSYEADMKRRDFFTLIGGAAVGWSVAAHSQQTMMPVVGFLYGAGPDTSSDFVNAVQVGLDDGASTWVRT
jgi:hypothetical protein